MTGKPDLMAAYPRCPAALGCVAESLITYVTDRPGHDRRYAIDSTKIERDLGFVPAVSLDDGLREISGGIWGTNAGGAQ